MRCQDTLCIIVAALARTLRLSAACITHIMEKLSVPAEGAKDDGKLAPPKKQQQQKLLSSCPAFPQISSSTASEKSKKADATVKRNMSLVDYEKRINALTQIAVDAKDKHASDGYLKELDRLPQMAERNKLICSPNENMCAELPSLQSQSKELTNENPHPNNFFKKAASLQTEIQRLAPIVGKSFDEMPKAVDACHASKIAMSECMRRCDFQLGLKWESACDSL